MTQPDGWLLVHFSPHGSLGFEDPLDLKACWKRIPTMMDAFRGGRWMAVEGPPKNNMATPKNSC